VNITFRLNWKCCGGVPIIICKLAHLCWTSYTICKICPKLSSFSSFPKKWEAPNVFKLPMFAVRRQNLSKFSWELLAYFFRIIWPRRTFDLGCFVWLEMIYWRSLNWAGFLFRSHCSNLLLVQRHQSMQEETICVRQGQMNRKQWGRSTCAACSSSFS
jgi:hypothetical protein